MVVDTTICLDSVFESTTANIGRILAGRWFFWYLMEGGRVAWSKIPSPGVHRCNHPRWLTCPLLTENQNVYIFSVTNKVRHIKNHITCRSKNLIYMTECRKVSKRYNSFQMSIESSFVFTLVLLYFAFWLDKKIRATFSTNQTNRDLLARVLPRLTLITCICFNFWLVHFAFCSCCDWLE